MEQIVPTPNQSLFDLQLDPPGVDYLRESAKWAKFIAIIGFIFCGLMVIASLFMGSILASSMSDVMGGAGVVGGGVFTVMYMLFAALWFVPCLYLFRFSSKMQVALRNNEQETLLNALKNLKSYFKFIGILLIIVLSLYAIAIIFMIGAFAMGGLAT